MKKLLLASLSICVYTTLSAQVSFSIVQPASIAGGYDFTSNGDGTNWGLADLNDPADAVMDTLMLVDDGTPGLNAQGVPLANEGCNTLVNDLTGKIAVVYRYDGVSSNVCWYGTKVLNAQNAGAVGVLMINREDALIDVPGTTDGPLTTIPFAFISKSDGEIIRAKIDAGEDVVAFIGNKLGLYGNDVGIRKEETLAPLLTATPTLTSQNSSEFGFDVGTQIYNYGTNPQNNVSITAIVSGPGGNWTQTAGPFVIPAGDSIDVYTGGLNSIPAFSLATYPAGKYTLDYSVDLGIADEAAYDNVLSYDFFLSDTIMSFSRVDTTSVLPKANANYRAGNGAVNFEMCMVYDNPNGSRVALDGMYFSAVTGYQSGVSLDGEEMALTVYQWGDVFTDLNDPNLDFLALNTVGYGFYYYPADLQGEVVYGQLDFPIQLADNQRYLACVSNSNTSVYMGYDSRSDYTRNVNHYLQPLCPIGGDGVYYALGFGTDLTPAMALGVFDAASLQLEENSLSDVRLYPNPAGEQVTISLPESMSGSLIIEDLSGRQLEQIRFENKTAKSIDVEHLTAGQYLMRIIKTDGSAAQVKFVKR